MVARTSFTWLSTGRANATAKITTLAAFVFVTGGIAAQNAQIRIPPVEPSTTTAPVADAAVIATTKKESTALDDDSVPTTDEDAAVTATTPVASISAMATNGFSRNALMASPSASFAAPAAQAVAPMLVGPGNPKYPLPAEATRAGLFMGTGGLVGSVGGALSPTLTSLLNPSGNYLSSGALNLATVNVTGTFQSVGIGSLGLVNLTPAGTTINGTLIGQNQHLTLLGGVTSDSYITNINRGADGFASNGLGGILLPSGSPAWSSDCASLLGIPLARCWAVNPAQDNQVLVGDKATANGSQEVVIGRGASHTLPVEDANTVFPGGGRNDPNNPTGVPTSDFAARKGNSVVIGDSAAGTANAQTIIGANASSSQVNSVALGNASVADRAAATGYTAFGLTGAQNSVGAVSVGSTANERQLTHVAAGTDNYDAVNVLQLKGATAAIGALDLLAVTYDPDGNGLPTNSLTFKGAGVGTGSVALHNVTAGALAAGSLDVVNGTQLNTTNQAIAAYFGGTTAANATGAFTAPTFNTPSISASGTVTAGTANNVTTAFGTVGNSLTNLNTRISNLATTGLKYLQVNSTGAASVATGVDSVALGAGATATNANSLALGAGSATTVGAQAGYTALGLAATQTSTGEVNVGTRKITGLAAGSSAGDAVNVAQLTGVNNAVTALGRLAVHYDGDGSGNPTNRITLSGTGAGTVGLGNLGAGAVTGTSTDAINGTQLNTTNQAVAAYFGGTTAANASGVFTAPTFSVPTINASGTVTAGTTGDVTTAFGTLGTSLGNVNTRVSNLYNTGLKYLQVNSTGAASAATGADSIALGAGASATNANSIALGAGAVTSVGAQTGYGAIGLGTLQNSAGEIAVGTRKITGLAAGSAVGDAVNVAQLTGVSGTVTALGRLAVQYDNDGAGNPTNRISLVGSGAGNVSLGNLAAGATTATSTDAITGAQLFNASTALTGYLGAGSVFDGSTGTFTPPAFSIGTIGVGGGIVRANHATVGDAFVAVDTSLGNLNLRLNALDANGSEYVVVNSTGTPASAAGTEAVAIGGNASAAATNAIAIGNGATAGNANSVALGAGSTTTVGAQTGYTAIGLTAPQTSTGEVNVGSRKLTGLAAGSAAGDAVNVAQLTGVNDSVGALGRLAVRYDDDGAGNPLNAVTFAGAAAGPVALRNVAVGSTAVGSTEAVNGGQLSTTNIALATYLGGGAGYDPATGTFAAPTYALVTVGADGSTPSTDYHAAGDAFASVNTSLGNINARLSAIGAGSGYVRVNSTGAAANAAGAEAIAIGGDTSASAANAIAIGRGASATNADSVAIGSGSATTVGAQTNYGAYGLVPLQTSSGEVNLGNRKITGVAAGSADSDAANIAQLRTVSGDVGSLGRFAVRYDDDGTGNPANSVSLVGAGGAPVALRNVAGGSLAAGSTDAVDGGQLNAAYLASTQSLGGGAAFDGATNTYTGPTFAVTQVSATGTVGTGNYGTVADAFGAANASVTNLNTRIGAIYDTGSKYVQVNSAAVPAAATATDAVAIGGGATAGNANSVALGSGSVTSVGAQANYAAYGIAAPQTSLGEVNVGTRKITGVAAGSVDTDAANIAQLRAVSGDVGDLGRFAVRYDDDGAGNPGNSITLAGATPGTPVALRNVAAGSVTAGSTDAINGGQLAATNQAVAGYLGGTTAVDATGAFTAPTFAVPAIAADGSVTSGSYGNVTDAFAGVGTSLGNVNARVSTLYTGGLKYFQVDSTGAASVASGTDAIAIGPGATAGNANSVALGANSVTTVGAQSNYLAFGLVAPQTSSGEVNVGNRKLTGLAAGSANGDAVNVAQLRGVSDSVGGLSALAVRYDDNGAGAPSNSVTFVGDGGGAPVALRNVAAGNLGATSTDAVNGSQIHQTRQSLVGALGAGAAVDPTTGGVTGPIFSIASVAADGSVTATDQGTVGDAFASTNTSVTNVNARVSALDTTGTRYFQAASTGAASVATGMDAVAIGSGATAGNANSVALGANSQTSVGARAGYAAYGLAAAQTSAGEVAIGNRQLTGLAAGSADQDAVNVAQLRAVNDAATSAGALGVRYDNNGSGGAANHITLAGAAAGTVGIGNLADGAVAAGGHDAVSGGQLFSTNDAMVRFFGGGASFDPLTATFTAPAFALHPVDGSGNASTASYANVGDALGSIDGSVNTLNARVNSLSAGIASPYLAVTSTQAAAAASGGESVAIGGATVASATESTAVGAQAKATAARALAVGAGSQATVDGGVAIGAGALADRIGSGTEAFSGNAIAAEGAVSVGSTGTERQITHVAGGTEDTDAVNLRQLRAVSSQVGSIGSAAVQYDDATHESVTFNAGGAPSRLGNVAAGRIEQGSADAINGQQLWTWTQDAGNIYSNTSLYNSILTLQQGGGGGGTGGTPGGVSVNNPGGLPDPNAAGDNSVVTGAGAAAMGSNTTAIGNGAQAMASNSVAIGAGSVADRDNTVSVGAAGATRQITNVSAGTADTDAANVSQVNAVRASSVHYDTLADGSVDYGNATLGNATTATTVHNVAAGKATTDAANVGQLNQVADWSKAYTDERVGSLNRDIEKTGNRASAGVASAMAMAGLPQATTPGRNMAAVAGGSFRGESSLAVGISTVTDGGGWVYKLSGTANSRGDAGFSVGAGMEW